MIQDITEIKQLLLDLTDKDGQGEESS
jgi:hypothetical protein